MILAEWARTWAVSDAALADLQARLGAAATVAPDAPTGNQASEAAVLARVRLAAPKRGVRLFRNNVGAGYAADGSFIRWGLANDSKALNDVIKSGDLIGLRPQIIQPDDVGQLFGRFVSVEVKRADWKYTGTEREQAQLNWATLVKSLGGLASFVTSEDQLP